MISFLLAFIPLFVAIDPIGTIPIYLTLTSGYKSSDKKKLISQAVLTAFAVGALFGIAGHEIFAVVGITTADFRIAGGLLLLILSIKEIFGATTKNPSGSSKDTLVGVVPLGIPLIAGPAMMTTILILHDIHSYGIIMAALIANLLIAYLLFLYSETIVRIFSEAMTKAIAKVTAIFLAAIAIMMIRKGIEAILMR